MPRSALLLLLAALSARSGFAIPPARHPVAAVAREVSESADAGRLDPAWPLERLVLVFPLRDAEALGRLLSAQQDPTSPGFRRWISPDEFGRRFGAPAPDLEAVAAWLRGEGFAVEGATRGRTALVFSGRAADVERAFDTELRSAVFQGRPHLTNVRPATMPADGPLAGVRVDGLLRLDSFGARRPAARVTPAPLYRNSDGSNALGPADFTLQYAVDPLLASGLRGAGRKVAIASSTQISATDVRNFRAYFGLPPREHEVVVNGPDPGFGAAGDRTETTLDVEWAGGVAPDATIIQVVTADTATAFGVDQSCLYAVDQDLADVVSLSYGACEASLSTVEKAFFTNLWAQAAAQGISAFVASGDSGAAGCDNHFASSGSVAGVNGLGSSPYATSVGGSALATGDDPALYWSETNDPVTRRSLRMPAPESAWNDSGAVPGGSGLDASGGGVSLVYSRPAWQSLPGAGAGSARLVPDVALAAANSSPYVIAMGASGAGPTLLEIGGTSAGAPAFAGITALLIDAAGGRLGNLNPPLYALAAAQYAGTGPAVFRDVVSGNNSVPGVSGFSAGPGYDAVTGLGTPDVAALAAALPGAGVPLPAGAEFELSVSPAVVALAPGGSSTVRIWLSVAGPGDPVAGVTLDPTPAWLSAGLSPAEEGAAGTAGFVSAGIPATLRLSASPGAGARAATLRLTAAAGGVTRSASVLVSVGGADFPPSGAAAQVPVVLSVPGVGGARFTSDLVAVNRSASDATLFLRYSSAAGTPGAGAPSLARSLPAGREFYAADAIGFLASSGVDFSGGDPAGTLLVSFGGVTDPALVFAGSRTSTPNPDAAVGGSFGTFSAAVPAGHATGDETWIFGLRENAAARSNLALVHAPAGAVPAGPVTVEVQLFDGDSGAPAGAALAEAIPPGGFLQVNRVLTRIPVPISNGFARVRRKSGADRFIAYGVVNDGGAGGGGTSDGSLVVSGGAAGLVPIVLDIPGPVHFRTELSLANPSSVPVRASLRYTPSRVFGTEGAGTAFVDLAAGRQILIADVIGFLRGQGLAIPDGRQGGTLLVTGAVALARTFNPNPDLSVGGSFGLSYPAVDTAARARTSALVYGLRQDSATRANLAIADARAGEGPVDYVVEVFDADTGASVPAATFARTLSGGEWTQIDGILAKAGIAHGWARVRAVPASSDFVAYGVLNDGAVPGEGTSDGSYLPMVVAE
jgi:pseudomonalisin